MKKSKHDIKYRFGQKIRRISNPFNSPDMEIGKIYTIKSFPHYNNNEVCLEGFDGVYNLEYFEPVLVDRCSICDADLNQFKTDTGYDILASVRSPEGEITKMCIDCFRDVIG